LFVGKQPQSTFMTSGSESAPAWLFSFVDLAFLLLIALTQVGGGPRAVDLGEVVVPRVNEAGTAAIAPGASERWQLRVHPPAPDAAGPFELRAPGAQGAAATIPEARLREQLARLREAGADEPLLAPHQDSRSQDLLDAIAAVEEHWPEARRAAVSPVAKDR
jgi:hypothetical protein